MYKNIILYNNIAFFLQIIARIIKRNVFSFFTNALFVCLIVVICFTFIKNKELTKYDKFSLTVYLILDVVYLLLLYIGKI